ncbi:MAG: hypothetical protein KDA51_16315, partial [Planctomycetales bacterium]|nr:hypothetical protein [Planctomycetales bacterium]
LLGGHAKECEGCRAMLRTQGRIFAGLRSLPSPKHEQDLGHRVLDQLRVDQRKRKNRRIMLLALATAAALMIALLPFAGDHVRLRQDGNGLALVTPAAQQDSASQLSKQEAEDLRLVMHQFMLRFSDHQLGMFEPVDQLASGIRPLAITFNFALDTLRRTFPGYSEPKPIEPQAIYREFRPSIS